MFVPNTIIVGGGAPVFRASPAKLMLRHKRNYKLAYTRWGPKAFATGPDGVETVSYTHLTLPTKRIV